MFAVATVVLGLTCGLLLACVLVQQSTIRMLQHAARVHTTTEHRLGHNVRRLQEELVHHAVESQVVTMWRNRNVGVS